MLFWETLIYCSQNPNGLTCVFYLAILVKDNIRIGSLEYSTDSNIRSLQVKPAADSTPMKRGSIAASAAAAAASTTPQPFVGSPALQERLEEKVANLQTQQELLQSKETIKGGCGIQISPRDQSLIFPDLMGTGQGYNKGFPIML